MRSGVRPPLPSRRLDDMGLRVCGLLCAAILLLCTLYAGLHRPGRSTHPTPSALDNFQRTNPTHAKPATQLPAVYPPPIVHTSEPDEPEPDPEQHKPDLVPKPSLEDNARPSEEPARENPAAEPAPVPVPVSPPAPAVRRSRIAADGSFIPTTDWKAKKLVFWHSDYHIAPIEDVKDLLKPFGVTLIIKSLSGHCHLTNTCAHDLRVLYKENALEIRDVEGMRRAFFEEYKNDPEMRSVDGFFCFYSIGMCELFMPFNKTIVALAATRYEVGREDPTQWAALNANLRAIAASPRNLIGGNNVYDAEYMRYFTGVPASRCLAVPSFCGYVTANYGDTPRAAKRPEILLGGMHVQPMTPDHLWPAAAEGIQAAIAKLGSKLRFEAVRKLYRHYEYSDLVAHPAMVHVPYQVSVMSYFEHYRMNIPLFFPSLDFLTDLQLRHDVLSERTWAMIRGRGKIQQSDVPKHPSVTDLPHDPNNEVDREALRFWLAKSDFYLWPHVQYFDSWEDLVRKVESADLPAISRAMAEYNKKSKLEILEQWDDLLERMFKDRPEGGYETPSDYETGMRAYRELGAV